MARRAGKARKSAASSAKIAEAHGEKELNDLILFAFIFIGLGIGLLTDQPGPGLLIGVGIGIVARGIAVHSGDREMLATSINVATLIIVIIGVYMVFLGLSLLYNFANLYPYAAGLPVIIIGMAFLFLFFLRTNRNKK